MAHAWNGCSQSSRFLPQARRIVGSGDENAHCDASGKKAKLLWCKGIFDWIKGNLTEIAPRNHQNVQETPFWAKSSGVQWVKSYWHRGLHPSPLPCLAPFTSSVFIRTVKAHSHFFIYFYELFHYIYAFQYRFYVFLNANVYQNNSKKCKLTPTWFEHAAFWSGVRRATIAPRSLHVSEKIAINVSLVRYTLIFHLKEERTYLAHYV